MNDFVDTHQWPTRRCTADACNQGRGQCPAPDACQISEDGSVVMMGRLLIVAIVAVASAVLWVAL